MHERLVLVCWVGLVVCLGACGRGSSSGGGAPGAATSTASSTATATSTAATAPAASALRGTLQLIAMGQPIASQPAAVQSLLTAAYTSSGDAYTCGAQQVTFYRVTTSDGPTYSVYVESGRIISAGDAGTFHVSGSVSCLGGG